MISNASLFALRLLSAAGHRGCARTDAMMTAIRGEDAKTIFAILACLHGHAAIMLDTLAGVDSPQRDQWLAELDERTEAICAQQAAFGRTEN